MSSSHSAEEATASIGRAGAALAWAVGTALLTLLVRLRRKGLGVAASACFAMPRLVLGGF